MTDYAAAFADVKFHTNPIAISAELAMDFGLIPDTRPPRPPLSRRIRWRLWRQDHLSAYALRTRLAHWIDPDPYKDEDPR